MIQRLSKFVFPIIILALSYRILVSNGYAQEPRSARVCIFKDALSVSLKVKGPYQILDANSHKVLSIGKNLKATVTAYRGGILIGGMNFPSQKLLIKANDADAVMVNNRRFRGNIQFIRQDKARLLVINYIELEDYIKGVLYHEASHYWPIEALKAQAVACRTFALYQMQENAQKDYDVTSDIYSQVYGGRTSERYRSSIAVEQTKGQVLSYQGKIFPAYYHATCAGHTEDASLLWKIDIPPLKGVPCSFCRESPHFKWHYVLGQDQIKEALGKVGHKIKDIKNIIVLGRDSSGRITELRIIEEGKDKAIDIISKDFRNAVGPNIIRSTNFSVKVINNDLVFEGFGWGHGAGLCQWGAYFMAKQGYNYRDILGYYYPGTKLT